MADLISRKALLTALGAAFMATDPEGEEQLGYLNARLIARKIPSVDAVEVVRCGDCIHRVRESWAKCTGRRPDEFCSDGERRFKDATE